MTPRELLAHKDALKSLPAVPVFRPQKRNKLPRPFHKLGGPRIFCTGMLTVSCDHVAMMYWRDGETFTDRSFYGYLMCKLASGSLSPVFEFHWHPSHKGFHCKTPCNTASNYTDRMLPGAPELDLKTMADVDPAKAQDLSTLVCIFCERCGISLPSQDSSQAQKTLGL